MLFFFFFNDTATTEIYTLSLHDALPIWDLFAEGVMSAAFVPAFTRHVTLHGKAAGWRLGNNVLKDRKSTRLNSSHQIISYAVFCLKKKKKRNTELTKTLQLDMINTTFS